MSMTFLFELLSNVTNESDPQYYPIGGFFFLSLIDLWFKLISYMIKKYLAKTFYYFKKVNTFKLNYLKDIFRDRKR